MLFPPPEAGVRPAGGRRRQRTGTALELIDREVAAIQRLPAVGRILEACLRSTGMRFAAIARVTDRRWTACAVRDELGFGMTPGNDLPLETTFCNEIRQHRQPVVFYDVDTDPRYATHPIPAMYGLKAYISVPIALTDGSFFGTLCALDAVAAPALRDGNVQRTFELFADLLAAQIEAEDELARHTREREQAHERADASESALRDEHAVARLREQFIAVLGHDLRSPLQALAMDLTTLRRRMPPGTDPRMLDRMERATARMTGLVGDVLDFARGRLGDGIPVNAVPDCSLAAVVEQVVAEVRAANPGRLVQMALHLDHPVTCDSARIAQLLANLMANAAAHGDPAQPIRLEADSGPGGSLRLSVHSGGAAIPPERRARLFSPFQRAHGAGGLGLGLYIAAEIARAHGGTLVLEDIEGDGNRFVFTLPAR